MPRPDALVFVVPGFPAGEGETDCLPAVQNYVAAFARARPEVAVHVIALQYPYARGTYRWHGVTVHALGGRNRRGVRRFATWVRAVRCFGRLGRAVRPRLVHSFWLTEAAWVGQWAAWRYGLPHVASVGGQEAQAGNPYLRFLRLEAATVTAGSAFAAAALRAATGHAAVHVVPLGLDAERLPPPAAVRDVDVLGVGSLVPVKDYEAFVRVVAALVPAFPGLHACLVGDGPEAGRVRRLAARLGLEGHLRLAGRLPREEVLRLMARSRVLLHPARYEAQGYVFAEALASGAHVVCRAVGYPAGGPHCHVCASEAEMAARLRALLAGPLAGPLDQAPVAVPTTGDTVRAFEALYGAAFAGGGGMAASP